MATYVQIQEYVKKKHGFVPQTCWIAHIKELSGLSVGRAHNRHSSRRIKPCPPSKVAPIREALEHFHMLDSKNT